MSHLMFHRPYFLAFGHANFDPNESLAVKFFRGISILSVTLASFILTPPHCQASLSSTLKMAYQYPSSYPRPNHQGYSYGYGISYPQPAVRQRSPTPATTPPHVYNMPYPAYHTSAGPNSGNYIDMDESASENSPDITTALELEGFATIDELMPAYRLPFTAAGYETARTMLMELLEQAQERETNGSDGLRDQAHSSASVDYGDDEASFQYWRYIGGHGIGSGSLGELEPVNHEDFVDFHERGYVYGDQDGQSIDRGRYPDELQDRSYIEADEIQQLYSPIQSGYPYPDQDRYFAYADEGVFDSDDQPEHIDQGELNYLYDELEGLDQLVDRMTAGIGEMVEGLLQQYGAGMADTPSQGPQGGIYGDQYGDDDDGEGAFGGEFGADEDFGGDGYAAGGTYGDHEVYGGRY